MIKFTSFSFLLLFLCNGHFLKVAADEPLDKKYKLEHFLFVHPEVEELKGNKNAVNLLAMELKIESLNEASPISFRYNEAVQSYINLFSQERRTQFSQMLGLADVYFPIFDEYLDRFDLPFELKYLAVVESALNPRAKSSSAAVGLWQFKINTAKMLDLHVDNYIDERRDPYKSTEAACKYLEYLYRVFDDWLLAIAAYNSGPGEVEKALLRAGGKKDYWEIREFLPEQTQNYIPAFIAATYLFKHAKEHSILPSKLKYKASQLDTVHVHVRVGFQSISQKIQLPIEVLEFYNPIYSKSFIPGGKSYPLVLPKEFIPSFIKNELSIYKSSESETTSDKEPGFKDKISIVHEVQKGEFFHKIALKYNCTVKQLLEWNKLDSTELREYQKLTVWVSRKFLDVKTP